MTIANSVALYCYRAYGLTLGSDTPSPALRESQGRRASPDVLISLRHKPQWVHGLQRLACEVMGPAPGTASGDDSPFSLTSFGNREFFQLAYGEGARFLVDSAATRIWGCCTPPLLDEDLVTYLLGPVMGFVLRHRGVLALHASAVFLHDSAVLLCGPSGSGKSTTAAALALRGIPVLAEDISPAIEKNGLLSVEPGYPRICLWPDAVGNLFGDPDALPPLTPTWEKCYLPLDGVSARFESATQPLGAVYIFAPRVEDADAPRIEELGKREALLELIQNTYMNWLLDREQRAAELHALAKVVENVPVRRIVPHEDPARIASLCDVILRDVERFLARQPVAAADS